MILNEASCINNPGKQNPPKADEKPIICITLGDPSGIGAEIIAKSLSEPAIRKLAYFIIVGDASVFKKAFILTEADFKYKTITQAKKIKFNDYNVLLLDLANVDSKGFEYGCIKPEYGKASIDYIKRAYLLVKEENADAMVTAPINKYSAKKAGFKHQGHTEFLAYLAKAKDTAMMLTGGPLSVILATTHLALARVADSLKKKSLFKTIVLIDEWMGYYFGVTSCKIGVCALNPHAGEKGAMGREEKDIITPAIELAKSKGINVSGPHPSDALFYQAYNGNFDVVLCMYHDQGLIPLKMVARDEAVNITLGLPFIRTSPAHGTAFDIAGKNTANPASFSVAIKTAVSMATRRGHPAAQKGSPEGDTLQHKKKARM